MRGVLYLFPDTNVFFQCQPLNQLDWSPWTDFDEIHVIISRPVQREIDAHKGKGSGRISDRAKLANRLLRETIKSRTFTTMHPRKPIVKLFAKLSIEPTGDLPLNYQDNDDRLVGIAHAFAKENPGVDVRIVTDDGGVIATAVTLDFPYVEIPENWFLPLETSAEQKRIAALEKENARLRSPEPRVAINCLNPDRKPVKKLEITHSHYPPLSESQIAELMTRLREGCPAEMSFEPKTDEAGVNRFRGSIGIVKAATMQFVPPTEAAIAEYQDQKYPKWLNTCQVWLGKLHELLNAEIGRPTVWFSIKNDGTRPGDDVLVTIRAEGGFLVLPPKRIDPDDKESKPRPTRLPAPPSPPEGKWVPKHLALWNHPGLVDSFRRPSEHETMADVLRALRPSYMEPHDPNRFYLKSGTYKTPKASFSRGCQQWRHAIPAEEIGVEIFFDREVGTVAGLLECHVHCANLSDPSTLRVPVRVVIEQGDTYERAEALVERRVNPSIGDLWRERREQDNAGQAD